MLDGVASQTVSVSEEKNLYFGKVVTVRVDICVHKVISIPKKSEFAINSKTLICIQTQITQFILFADSVVVYASPLMVLSSTLGTKTTTI